MPVQKHFLRRKTQRVTKGRRTQIICTLGPACRSPSKIEALIEAGMNVARLHFSYAKQSEHGENIRRIRRAAAKLRKKVLILQDLSGAKVRLGALKRASVGLKQGANFTLTSRDVEGDATIASVSIPEVISVIKVGDTVLLADGALKLKALAKTKTDVRCQVIVGGVIKANEAVHVPDRTVPVTVPTRKDFDDIRFGIKHGVDWIALSYATSAEEINNLRTFIKERGATTRIVAKIERRQALKNLKAMIAAADLVMVARGDLGLEIPLETIALVQKQIIAAAKRAGKPAITATEMMFSMMEHDRPTRAEVSDVTNAVLDGSKGVMLSGETGMGKFPIEAVRMMAKIIVATESQ